MQRESEDGHKSQCEDCLSERKRVARAQRPTNNRPTHTRQSQPINSRSAHRDCCVSVTRPSSPFPFLFYISDSHLVVISFVSSVLLSFFCFRGFCLVQIRPHTKLIFSWFLRCFISQNFLCPKMKMWLFLPSRSSPTWRSIVCLFCSLFFAFPQTFGHSGYSQQCLFSLVLRHPPLLSFPFNLYRCRVIFTSIECSTLSVQLSASLIKHFALLVSNLNFAIPNLTFTLYL